MAQYHHKHRIPFFFKASVREIALTHRYAIATCCHALLVHGRLRRASGCALQDMQFDGKQEQLLYTTRPRQTDPQQHLAQGAIAEESALARGQGSSLFGFQFQTPLLQQYTTPRRVSPPSGIKVVDFHWDTVPGKARADPLHGLLPPPAQQPAGR